MRKDELIEQISIKKDMDKAVVKTVVLSLLDEIKNSLAKGDSISLRGFATISLKKRAEKNFHYAPGKYRLIPEHYEPYIKFCKEFVNNIKKKSLS